MEIFTLGKLHRSGGGGRGGGYNTALRHPAGLTVTTARVSRFGNLRAFPLLRVGQGGNLWLGCGTIFFISSSPGPEMAVPDTNGATGWESAGAP